MSLPVEFLLIDALRHLDSFSVPGIGSFYRAYIPAKVQEGEKKIQAPREIIQFTEDISPSGIRALEQFLNRPGNPAAEQAFAAETMGKEINQVLNFHGKYELKGLGRLLLGSTGLEAEWNEDVHQAIYSNLFGFKDVPLPAKQFGKLTSPAIPSVVTPAPVVPPKEVAPVAAAAQPTIEVVPQEPIVTPSPVLALPEVEIQPIPKPFEEALNQPIVPEEKPVSSTPEPNVVIVSEDTPKPAATENVAPVPGPAQKAVDNFRKKEERKKRKFPWAITLIVLLLILLAGLWFVLPQKSTEPVAPAAVEVPNAEIPKAEVPAPPIEEPIEIPASQPGYHLIVASSSKEADVLKEAEYWKSQGMTTEVIPPDTLTDFYRLSVLHSTQRGEVVAKMIELKDETYSWILERN